MEFNILTRTGENEWTPYFFRASKSVYVRFFLSLFLSLQIQAKLTTSDAFFSENKKSCRVIFN